MLRKWIGVKKLKMSYDMFIFEFNLIEIYILICFVIDMKWD